MSSPTLFIKSLDPRWDSLRLAANEQYIRTARGVAHCDCFESNEAFFPKAARNADELYLMVPVRAEADETCPHCGYHVHYKPEVHVKSLEDARSKFNHKAKAVAAGKYKVVGRNSETGEVVEFPTAKAAYAAGFGAVSWAINQGREVKGWTWTRTVAPQKQQEEAAA